MNEVDHLRELVHSAGITGVAHLTLDIFEDDEEVLVLADDNRITMSYLNPILLAIRNRSFDCLTYLVGTFGVRQAMGYYPINLKLPRMGVIRFRNLMMPLILRSQDHDILAYLLKHEGFIYSRLDNDAYIDHAIHDRWFQGLRTFLWSNNS